MSDVVEADFGPLEPPEAWSPAADDLWRRVTGRWDLEPHELLLLREACRSVDTCDALADALCEQGVLAESGLKPNPVVVEARQQRVVLARMLAALQLPTDEGKPTGIVRGFYRPRSGRGGDSNA